MIEESVQMAAALACAAVVMGAGLGDQLPLLTDLLVAVGVGTLAGKIVIVWREQAGADVPAQLARKLELRWIGAAVTMLVLAYLISRLVVPLIGGLT